MGGRDIVVIGASAGGVSAIAELASGLPPDLPAALFVAVHSSPDSPGMLAQMVGQAGPLPAGYAIDGEPVRPGRFYVAPPDRHLLVDDGRICVTRGPRENGFRPAVDPLFRTAARTNGARVVGVVLSGGLDDGTRGLADVKRHGGVAIVQHVDDAIVPHMPLSAIQNVEVDHVLTVREMPAVITRLATEPLPKGATMAHGRAKSDVAVHGGHGLHEGPPKGPPSALTCPQCGGALWEHVDGKIVSYNCHVGHVFTGESLLVGQEDGVESALWSAVRALEEKAALRRRMANHARLGKFIPMARRYEEQAEETETQANVVRTLLTGERARAATGARPAARRRRQRAARAAKRRQQ